MDNSQEVKPSEEAIENLQNEEEDLLETPGWLPDGWIMEVNCNDDGTIYRLYTCPVSGFTFTMKSEVLHYLFSGMDHRFLESKNCAVGNNLTRTHEWLPKGWHIEIRAGGENMDKMFKEDVLLYINETKISVFDTNGHCNTNTKDNILATLEFSPDGLPEGWVKEVAFRKTKCGIRKDSYYTDPVKNFVFRSLKSAALYLETGEVTKCTFVQRISVHELYSFEKSADLHESLWKRVEFRGGRDQLHTRPSKHQNSSPKENILNNEQNGDYSDNSDSTDETGKTKAKHVKTMGKCKEVITSNTIKLPRGKPSTRANKTK